MGMIKLAAKAWFNNTFRYTVINTEYKGVHVCNTLSKAVEWMDCYPSKSILIHPRF
jgi:hypothetical protein